MIADKAAECLHTGNYVAENKLESRLCSDNNQSTWNKELQFAWEEGKTNVVAVSGQMDTGGGVVLSKTILPHVEIAADQSLILTAAHLVDKKRSILVGAYDAKGELGGMDQAKLVALDRTRDLALLSVALSRGAKSAGIKSENLGLAEPGEKALAVLTESTSRALGLFEVSANHSYGEVGGAAIRKHFPTVTMKDETNLVVLTTADLPGTSGSPLIGARGRILGLVSQRLPEVDANKVRLDQSKKPLWQSSAVVSSKEIKTFLQQVDRHSANKPGAGRHLSK